MGRAQSIVAVATPSLVQGSTRKQVEQALWYKSARVPWPLHKFLLPDSCPVQVPGLNSFNGTMVQKCKPNRTFPPQLAFGHNVSS